MYHLIDHVREAVMNSDQLQPVVALELDGVIRVPGAGPRPEVRETLTAEITMRRSTFPSYTLTQPPWDEVGEWSGVHTFSAAGVRWVRELAAAGTTVVWTSSWGAYANVYFGTALGIPELPFRDAADVSAARVPRWLLRTYGGRPLLWVNADAGPEAGAALRARALTRLHVPDREVGITGADVDSMNDWLDMVSDPDGRAELRRRRRRGMLARAATVRREMWGDEGRYRRRRAARTRLLPALGEGSTLLTLLADYALECGADIDRDDVERLREEWGGPDDPSAHELIGLLEGRGDRTGAELVSWAGHGYPPQVQALMDRASLVTLEVGRGWWPLLVALDTQLAQLDSEYTVGKVRSSGGRLQFEAASTAPGWQTDRVARLVRATQARAAGTCERCGRPGARCGDSGAVLCEEHSRPLSDDEIACAIAAGVPADAFAHGGGVEATLIGLPQPH